MKLILFKMNSEMLLEGTVILKGNTLLISREGFEHLQAIHAAAKKKSNLAENKSKVYKEVVAF